MINLYKLLHISITATDEEIRLALKKAADEQTLDWEKWQNCRKVLLNPELREKYNAKLIKENPQLKQEIIFSSHLPESVEIKEEESEYYEQPAQENHQPEQTFTIKIPFLALNRKLIPMFNPDTGKMKIAYTGFTAAPIILAFFTPLLVKDIRGTFYWFIWYVIASFLGVQINLPRFSVILFIIIMCFYYCNRYTKSLLKQGFKFCGSIEQNNRAARFLKIELNLANTVSNVKVNQVKEGIFDKIIRLFILFPLSICCLAILKLLISLPFTIWYSLHNPTGDTAGNVINEEESQSDAGEDKYLGQHESISIPFDEPNTTYTLIWHHKKTDGLVEAVSRRAGVSGTSYSKKEINCEEHSSRYLGEGDSIEEALILRPDDHLTYADSGSAGATIDTVCSLINN